jgi:hypothetical protein
VVGVNKGLVEAVTFTHVTLGFTGRGISSRSTKVDVAYMMDVSRGLSMPIIENVVIVMLLIRDREKEKSGFTGQRHDMSPHLTFGINPTVEEYRYHERKYDEISAQLTLNLSELCLCLFFCPQAAYHSAECI